MIASHPTPFRSQRTRTQRLLMWSMLSSLTLLTSSGWVPRLDAALNAPSALTTPVQVAQRVTPPAKAQAITPAPAEAPLSFSDPDGQDLVLEKLDVRAAVQGPLSLTELELFFRNPYPKRMEGRFTITLPPGATISRFAKEVNGQLMEGEVVEKLKANQVYDAILHEMRDPALLEQDQGNRFSARIFPIEANAQVRLVLSYSRNLPLENGIRTFDLALRGLPTLKQFHFRGFFGGLPGEVTSDLKSAPPKTTSEPRSQSSLSGPKGATTSTVQVLELNETNYTPTQDLQVHWRPAPAAPAGTSVPGGALKGVKAELLEAGDFFLTRIAVPDSASTGMTDKSGKMFGNRKNAESGTDTRPWTFFVDTSASVAEGEQHRIKALEQVLKSLPPATRVHLFAFDQSVQSLGENTAAHWAEQLRATLETRHSLGGTDLHLALSTLQEQAKKSPNTRFVLVSDGVATLGKTKPSDILDAAAQLPAGTVLHALVLGSRQDTPTLDGLTKGHGRVVQIPFTDTMEEKATEATARLQLPPGMDMAVSDASAEWIFPSRFTDVQPGSELLVVGKRKKGTRPALTITQDKDAVAISETSLQRLPMGAFEPLLEREGYRAYLSYLAEREAQETNPAVRQALVTEQVRVSIEKRVLIPRTTLLVLETEQDYARFGLDRRALTAILTIDAGGINYLNRTQTTTAQAVTPVRPEPRPEPRDLLRDERLVPAKPVMSPSDDAAPEAKKSVSERTSSDEAERPRRLDAGDRLEEEAQKESPIEAVVDSDQADGSNMGVVGTVGQAVSGGASAGLGYGSGGGGSAPSRAEGPSAPPPAEAPAEREERSQTMSASGRGSVAPRQVTAAVTVPAPSASASPSTELRRDPEQIRQQTQQQRPVTAPAAPSLPEWTQPDVPSDETLQQLRTALAQQPKDRRQYNALTDALWKRADWKGLLGTALQWQAYDPENPQVYEAIGESALQLGQKELAARAFASLVEIAPNKPELLQRAGLLLLRAQAGALSETPLRKALEVRPDRVNTYRHLALLLWQLNRPEEAAVVLEEALKQSFQGWYGNVIRVVKEELGYIYRAWAIAEPSRAAEIQARARSLDVDLSRTDDFRATLVWETDANDVDLHVVDPNGEECYYSHKNNVSGLELYEDITQGFGPEVARGQNLPAGDYYVGVNYFSAGPMGVSRGVLAVITLEKGQPQLQLLPYRLVEGGRDMRLLSKVTLSSTSPAGAVKKKR